MKNDEYYQVPGIVLGIDNMFNAMGLYRSEFFEKDLETEKRKKPLDTLRESGTLDKK